MNSLIIILCVAIVVIVLLDYLTQFNIFSDNILPSYATHWAANTSTGERLPVCFVDDFMLSQSSELEVKELSPDEWQVVVNYTLPKIIIALICIGTLVFCAVLDYITVNV